MRTLVRSIAVVLSLLLLSAPARLQSVIGGDTRAYIVITVVLAVLEAWLVLSWRRADDVVEPASASPRSMAWAAGAGALAFALVVVVCRAWLRGIFTVALDPYRGDMLVVVREGLRRIRLGLNPYTIYHVPWAAPLPYGPLLWGPFAIPMWLRLDLRFLTVAGALFVPIACAVAAAAFAARGQLAAAAGSLLMLAAIGFDPALRAFTLVGHTPVYWPLLALFAWLVTRERWRAAGVTLGLLVAARSTMVAVVPVLLIAVWLRDRRAAIGTAVLTFIAVAVPFLPFAIADPTSLTYAMYGSYEKVIKEVVWPDPTVPHTIGLTGVLLSHHWQSAVETVQLIALALTYAGCWLALSRRRAPVGVMAAALLAFSMTTLWPVYYLYFDVFLLLTAGIIAASPAIATRTSAPSLVAVAAAIVVVDAALVAANAALMLPARTETSAVTWRDTPRAASVVVLRRSASGALVDVELRGGAAEGISVQLNGVPIGPLSTTLAIPVSAWHIGANALQFDNAPRGALVDVGVR